MQQQDEKVVFKEYIRKVVGDYIPNEVDLNNLVNYLYKVAVISFKDTDMRSEYQSLSGVNSIDIEGFKKSLKVISVNASRDLLFSVMKESFNTLKNQIPSSKCAVTTKVESNVINTRTVGSTADSSLGEFNIDLQKANEGKPAISVIAKSLEESMSNESRVQSILNNYNKSKVAGTDTISLDLSTESLDNINKGIPSNLSRGQLDDDKFDFTGDSSIYTEGSYTTETSVDLSLDY